MKRSTIFILFLLLTAFAVRVWNLAGPSVWWDEAYTVQTARYDWATFWQLQTIARHPPLYFLTVRVWGNLAGWSEFSLRFLSVAYSLLGIALVYQLTRRLFDRRAGLGALALAALSPALIVYAQEGRMYAMVFMLAAATLYFGFRIFNFDTPRDPLRLENVPFLLCEALLLLTHYFTLPFVAALNLLALANLFYHRARLRAYVRWISGQVLAVLPVMIWVALLGLAQGTLTVANEPRPNLLSFIYEVSVLWVTGIRDLQGRWSLLFAALLGLTVLILIGAWFYHRRRTLALTAFGGMAIASAFLFANVLTSFHPRYVLLFSLPAYVLAGAALAHMAVAGRSNRRALFWTRLAGGVTIALLTIVVIAGWAIAADPQYAKDDARSVAAYLKQHATADDVILVEAHDYTLAYYEHGPAALKMILAGNESDAFQELSAAVGSAKRVWFSHWPIASQDPEGYWPFLLEQSGSLRDWTSFHGYELYGYDMQSALHEPALVDHVEADQSPVKRVALGYDDTAITAAVEWQAQVRSDVAARVSLRLLDARGNGLIIRDMPLLNDLGQTTDQWTANQRVTNYYVLPIPPGTSPGTYTVTTQLYSGHNVFREDVLGTVSLPRRLDTSDPYRTLSGYAWEASTEPVNIAGLELESLALGTHTPWQPMPIDVTLRWRKTGETENVAPRLRLAQADRVWGETGSPLLERDYPIGQWAIGETVIDRLKIGYPPLRGPIELQIGQGDQWTTLTTLQLDESRMMFSPPQMQHEQAAQFGDFAQLLGYDLKSDSLAPDRPLPLTLYWHATNTEPITTPYTVFTQILAPDGHLVAQHDVPPAPPTTAWVPGQVVIDEHPIKVVDPAYRGPATLIVGWYNSASVERVPAADDSDHVTLQTPVRVEDK